MLYSKFTCHYQPDQYKKCLSERTTMHILLDPWTIVVITTEIVKYIEFLKMKLCNIRVGRSPNQFEDSLESKCT